MTEKRFDEVVDIFLNINSSTLYNGINKNIAKYNRYIITKN